VIQNSRAVVRRISALALQKVVLLFLCALFLSVISPNVFPQTAEAEQHASQGLQLAQSGKLREAELELRRAVALAPNNAGYLADLGGILGMERNLKEADVFFGKAVHLDPDNRMIRRDLAANEWQLGELNSAKGNLERLLRDDPGDKPSTLLLGMVEANLKNYSRAALLLSSVSDLSEQHPGSLAALARACYHTGQRARARETLANLASRFHNPSSIFLAGKMAEEGGDAETAERLFTAIRTTYPDPPRVAYHLAHAEYIGGSWADCQRTLSGLIAAGHGTSETYDLLGRCYAKQNAMTEAAKALKMAIALSPSSDSNYLALTSVLSDHGLRETAIEVMASCVKAIPKSFDCYEEKGRIESSQHYYKQAFSSFSRAAQLNPSSADAEFGLAASLAGLGRRREAAAAYETAIRLNPHRAEFPQAYAKLLLDEAGQTNTALKLRAASLLEKAISLDPSGGESRLLLGQLWLDEGRTRTALPLLQAAARLDPQNGRPHYLLWRAYQKLGRHDQAASELAEFKRLSLKTHEPHGAKGRR
jgi:tetratricopeptide (TPR) repeat protein